MSYAPRALLSSRLGTFPWESPLFRNPAGRSKGTAVACDRRVDAAHRRTEVLSVRLLPHEHQKLTRRADLCGTPLSTYLRTAALGTIPRARPRRVEEKAIYHLGRIGNNLNQLAYVANATGRLGDTRHLNEVLTQILSAIRHLS